MAHGTQIRIVPGGEWHRPGLDHETACGQPIGGAFSTRDWVLDDKICQACFTRHEHDTGRMLKITQDLEESADPGLFYDPDDEPTDPDGDPDASGP